MHASGNAGQAARRTSGCCQVSIPGSGFRLVARTQSATGGVGAQLTACAVERRNPSEPMIAFETVLRPWQKVGTDMFVYKKATYLLVVDYASSYVEIAKLAATTSPDVILHLRSIFARHGIPETVVSDNGPQLLYASYEFARFASEEGFIHVTSSPRYAQSNGKAERTVQSVKARHHT